MLLSLLSSIVLSFLRDLIDVCFSCEFYSGLFCFSFIRWAGGRCSAGFYFGAVSLGAVVVLLFYFGAGSLGAVVVLLFFFLVLCHWGSREMRATVFCFYFLIAH